MGFWVLGFCFDGLLGVCSIVHYLLRVQGIGVKAVLKLLDGTDQGFTIGWASL